MRVLIISYFYPPFDCTASVEASKFTKYLHQEGWSPVVISTASDFPATLPLEIPEENVHRTKQIDINLPVKRLVGRRRVAYSGYVTKESPRGRWMSRLGRAYRQVVDFPDPQIGWYPFALAKARRTIRLVRPDVVLSSAWPVTNHLVAARVAREARVPWVADFRDLWTDNHHFQRLPPLSMLERRWERRVMRQASVATAPSEEWAELLARRFGCPSAVIHNGFDPEDYPARPQPPRRFTLLYTGVYYPGSQDPSPLFEALRILKEKAIISSGDFSLRFVGRYVELLRPTAERLGIDDLVSFQGSVSHSEALTFQAEASVLLFLTWLQETGRGWNSAKLYEYFGTRHPVLGVGPAEGAAADLISRTGAGVVLNEHREIASVLAGWIKEFRESGPLTQEMSAEVEEYRWDAIVAELAKILDKAVADAERRPG